MKPGEEDTKEHELVLIRRRAPVEEGGHHGGVWKIAYADFMTAMMAFFLVMWLINSTDQKVLTQVANYFNPMRLTDSIPHTRGVNTIESGEQGKEGKQSAVGDPKEKKAAKDKSKEKPKDKSAPAKSDAKEDKEASKEAGKEAGKEGKARYAEQALFSDPYGVLARIAAEAETDGPPPVPASKDGSGAGGDVYLDPFDPAAQRTAPEKRSASPKAAPGQEAKKAKPAPAEGEAKTPQDTDTSPKVVQGLEAKKVAPAAGGEAKLPQENAVASRETSVAAEKAENAAAQEVLKSAKQAAAQATAQKAATKDEAAKIENEIKQVTSRLQGTIPNIDVTVTDDGVLISLTDDYDFGMFAIASAEPRPAMVVVMEKMAKILQAHQQPLVVRGHTDGRPYRSGSYDNWRLSTARAHMAYYMLVRGGIDEKRFERVEGYADRSLRVPDNPEAAQNRRIEILLRRSKQ